MTDLGAPIDPAPNDCFLFAACFTMPAAIQHMSDGRWSVRAEQSRKEGIGAGGEVMRCRRGLEEMERCSPSMEEVDPP